MESFETFRSLVKEICRRALAGSMTIREFYEQWPDGLTDSKLAELLYSDIEDGVQHFPASVFSGTPDMKLWVSSDMYRRLVVADAILDLNLDESVLTNMRATLLSDRKLAVADIPSKARQLAVSEGQ